MRWFFLILLFAGFLPLQAAAEGITINQARQIALGQEVGRIDRIDKETDANGPYYRFEIIKADKSSVLVKVDARSGEVISSELYRLPRDMVLPPGSITQKQAKKIAQEHVRMIAAETGVRGRPLIYDAKYNLVDGNVAYQIGVRVKKDRYTVFVDPASGRVLAAW